MRDSSQNTFQNEDLGKNAAKIFEIFFHLFTIRERHTR